MSKILKPTRLVQVFLFLLIVTPVGYLVSCNQGGGGREGGTPVNPDTVKNHVISIGAADQMTANFRAALDTLDKKVPHFHDSMDFGHAEAFPADVFRALLGKGVIPGQLPLASASTMAVMPMEKFARS